MNNYMGSYYKYYQKRGSDFMSPTITKTGIYSGITGYSPEVLRNYYSFPYGPLSGNGIRIGIVDAYGSPTIEQDTQTFSTRYNLPTPKITVTDLSGGTAAPDEWMLETTLDVQWAHAFAPEAEIHCYFAGSDDFVDIFDAIRRAADECDIVSMSFGKREFAGQVQYESFFENAPCLFVCSSGDSSNTFYPAASKYVLAVGGTSLYLTSEGRMTGEEYVWSRTGCGISRYIDIPDYQNRMEDAREICMGMRGIPDIAFFASGVYGASVYHSTPADEGTGWTQVYGTSVSAPCVAGICACMAQKNREVLRNMHDFLYNLAGGTRYTNENGAYYDVTRGSSGNFSARVGFDLCSGLGTPVVSRILSALE